MYLEVYGVKAVVQKHIQVVRDLNRPFRNKMREASRMVWKEAKSIAPHDTGALARSLAYEVRSAGGDVYEGVVGSGLTYAPFVELGTGVFAGNAPYFPPPRNLEGWAARHGTTGLSVAMSIYHRGGTRQQRYLLKALYNKAVGVYRLVGNFVSKVVAR